MKQGELIQEIMMTFCLGETCKSDDLVKYFTTLNEKAVNDILDNYKSARKPILKAEKEAKKKEEEIKEKKLLLMAEEIKTNLENELRPIIKNEILAELEKTDSKNKVNTNLEVSDNNKDIKFNTKLSVEQNNTIKQSTIIEDKIINNNKVDDLINSVDWTYETGIIKSNHEKFNVFITKSENDAITIFYKKHNNYLIRRITNIDNNKLGFKEELFDPNLKIWKDISNTQF